MVKAITYIIKNDATCVALIGNNRDDDTVKVYPVIATQREDYPFVNVRQSGRVPIECRGQRPTSFEYTYDVNVYTKDYDSCETISRAIIDALENQSITDPINGVTFTDRIRNVNEFDADYVDEYECYAKVVQFASVVHEDQAT